MQHTATRILMEDALKHLHEYEYEGQGRPVSPESLAGAVACSRDDAVVLLATLCETGWVQRQGQHLSLTSEGREAARQIIRTHRLLETYLAQASSLPSAEWHREADRMEHRLGPEQADRLDRELGHPRFDPHGDPIPTADGTLPPRRGTELSACREGQTVEILHVADEPENIGRALEAKGLAPGQPLRILEQRPGQTTVLHEGSPIQLSETEASEVQVRPLENDRTPDLIPLSELTEGQSGEVESLSPACRGAQRTRLLDLGFVRGSSVQVEIRSPLGSPTAYRIRGTCIALRPVQARWVLLKRDSVS